eukprot:gene16477-18115_t
MAIWLSHKKWNMFNYYELTNGFGANRDALLMATYFVLGRILRQTLPTMERRNTDESKIGLLFAQEMNVGKTLSQKILNLGQGSHEEDGCLLLSGGDSVTGGTSITMLQKYLEDTTMVVMLNDSRFNRVNSEALYDIMKPCIKDPERKEWANPKPQRRESCAVQLCSRR